MKQLDIDEIKKRQLSILDYVHSFCVENDIHYSLSGGTLIGAVRHKGYIPWDDDIDIMMPRPDYEKFCKIFNFNKDSGYKVLNSYNDKDFFQPFSKVVDVNTVLVESYDRPIKNLGVNIDVFPIDGLPNNSSEREEYWKRIFKKRNFATVIYTKNNRKEHGMKKIIRLILFYLYRPFPANILAKKLHRLGKHNTFENSNLIANSIFGYGKKEEMPGNLFSSFIDVEFENRKFKAVKNYDVYLSNLFGDYMKLPPENERISKHEFKAFLKS